MFCHHVMFMPNLYFLISFFCINTLFAASRNMYYALVFLTSFQCVQFEVT